MASYNPPNPYVPGAFNPTQFITPSDNITTKFLDENYLRFPFAQGVENFVSINNQGSLNQGGLADFSSNTLPAIFNLPPTITNPIANTATTPSNAVATIGYVFANEQGGGDLLPLNNLWTGVNNFNPPVQTYGSTLNQGITITNNQDNSAPAGDNDIISYTPSSTQGLCIYSSSTNSVAGKTAQIVLQPDGVRTSLFASGTNGIVQLNALGGTQSKIVLQASSGVFLQLTPTINFNDLGTLSATATGISSTVNFTAPSIITPSITQTADNTNITVLGSGNNSAIVLNSTAGVSLKTNPTISFGTFGTLTGGTSGLSTASDFTAKTITVNSTGNDKYVIYPNSAGGDFGLVIANTSGGNGTLTLSNNSTTLTTLSSTTDGLTINDAIILPAQTTYTPSTTYGNVGATQQFVQLALASQGSGDVTLGGTNNFTGTNTFNVNVPTSSVSQTASSPNTQFSTIGLVKGLISAASPEINSLTFINIGAPNIDPMTPASVSAQVIYNPASNTAQFISCETFYTTQNNNLGGIPFCNIQFNIKPWSAFPPPNFSSTINTYCSTTGSVYNCQITWSSSAGVYTMSIKPPNTLTFPVPATFTINLMNMGVFQG